MNKKINEPPISTRLQPCQLKAKTYHDFFPGIPLRGKLSIIGDTAMFVENELSNRIRNKQVFRSKFFSVRITDDGQFNITCHLDGTKISKIAYKKTVTYEFVKMMTAIDALINAKS